jgi:hypothetical protein
VVDEVEEELREPIGIAAHRREVVRLEHEPHPGVVRLRLERGSRRREELRRLDALLREILPARLEARHLEQAFDHANQAA